MSLLEDLRKAYAFHLENEWCQHVSRYRFDDGRFAYCAAGAVFYALGRECGPCKAGCDPHMEHTPESTAVIQALCQTAGDLHDAHGIVHYNDAVATSKADVSLIFEQTIRRLEAEGEQ